MNRKALLAIIVVVMMVSASTVTIASDSYAESKNSIIVNTDHGELIDLSTGAEYVGGPFRGELNLCFNPNEGYEFTNWIVDGKCTYTANNNTIKITSVGGTVTLSVDLLNYARSQNLINVIDVDTLLGPEDEIVKKWAFSSADLDTTGGMWRGMPSVPLVVGDTVYIRAGEVLYAVDVDRGIVKNRVDSPGDVSFYHYLGYGNKTIFDMVSQRVYDLELNYLYDIPSTVKYITYVNGDFYGFQQTSDLDTYTLFKTSAGKTTDLVGGVKVNLSDCDEEFKLHQQYLHFCDVTVVDNWIFFLEANGYPDIPGYRGVVGYDTDAGKVVRCPLKDMYNFLWDEGWLSYYNGYFYITGYPADLFDFVDEELKGKHSSIMWFGFDFNKGEFKETHFAEIKTAAGSRFSGIASGLEVYEGRGYINVRAIGADVQEGINTEGSCLISYDIASDGTPVPKEASASYMTHGGIVINTAHYDEGKLHVYVVPYNSGDSAVYIFTDELKDDGWVLKEKYKKQPTRKDWGSQAIRPGPNGEIIYYTDAGYVDCYIASKNNRITVLTMDYDSMVSTSSFGASPGDGIYNMNPTAMIYGGNVIIGDKTYQAYGLNEMKGAWTRMDDLFRTSWSGQDGKAVTESPYRYVALLEEGSQSHFRPLGSNGWFYKDIDDVNKKVNISSFEEIDANIGKPMRYFEQPPEGLIIPKSVSLPYSGSFTFMVSKSQDWTFKLPDESIAKAERNDDGTLTLKHVFNGTTELTISCGGADYLVEVVSMPKIYVDDEGYVCVEVLSKDVDEDGHNVEIKNLVRRKGTISESLVERCIYDGSILLRTEKDQTINDRMAYVDDHGNPVSTVEINNVVMDGNGEVLKDRSYASDTVRITNKDGSVTVRIIEADSDNLTMEKVLTETEKVTKGSVTNVEVSVTNTDGDVISTDHYVESSVDDNTTARVDGDTIIIELSGTDADIVAMSGALSDDESMTIIVRADSIVSEANMASAADAGAVMEYSTDGGMMVLGSETLTKLSTRGNMSFTIAKATAQDMTEAQKDAVKDIDVFSLKLRSGETNQTNFGEFTIHLDCSIDVREGKQLQVWRVDDSGKMIPAENVSYKDGVVTFDSDHLSVYAVGYEEDLNDSLSGSIGDIILYVLIGSGAIFAGVLVFYLVRRNRV